jgi:hypothetical protein
VTGQLEATHDEELDEVPEVQTGRGGVEPAVVGDRVAREQSLQLLLVGRHVDEPAPHEFVPDVLEGRIVALFRESEVRHACKAISAGSTVCSIEGVRRPDRPETCGIFSQSCELLKFLHLGSTVSVDRLTGGTPCSC